MGIKQSLKSFIGSNTDALHNNMFTRPLMPRKGSDVNFSYKPTQAAWKDMREADKVVNNQKDRIAETKTAFEKATTDGDAAAVKTLEGKLKGQESQLKALNKKAANKSQTFGETAWDYAKTPLNYLGAKDYAGQDGRAMAIAARTGAVGAAWMGVNGLGRMATGGGMTYNNTGERDIAGIPFI